MTILHDSYYITTPIYYVNDIPHLGHAYTTLAADVTARFMRMDGKKVYFLTGTDEHGQKVEKAAEKNQMDPLSFTDKVSKRFRHLAEIMHFTHDDFIRTTETRHKKAVEALWECLAKRTEGGIYLSSYKGWYAVRDEAFYDESELIDGKAPTGAEVEWVEEPSFFFALSYWQEALLNYYKENPDFISPVSRRNEVLRFVESGLKDLSISRTSFTWGIPVPGKEDHIIYVWLDALTNYITALGYPDITLENFSSFWPADIHFVGKDILRFHAVFWPAFLMAAGIALPKKIVAHGWWTCDGQKMSKSLGNVVNPVELVKEYGLDAVRYFLLREIPFGSDGNYSASLLIQRYNSELANTIGNLAQRTLRMVQNYCEGKIPQPGIYAKEDQALIDQVQHLLPQARDFMHKQQFHLSLEAIGQCASHANRYIDISAPWILHKARDPRLETILYVTLETLRMIALLLYPFIPNSMKNLLEQLAVPEEKHNFSYYSDALEPNNSLPQPSIIFPKIIENT